MSVQPRRAIVLTAIPAEYGAVRSHLLNVQEDVHPAGTIYERGSFDSGSWDILIAEIGEGNENAAQHVERAVAYFTPELVLFVGVAGGVKDVAIGDVVASTKIYAYDSGKDGEEFVPRPAVAISSHRSEQRARAIARSPAWNGSSSPRRAFVGPIAAGPKVVSSTKSATFKFIRSHYGDSLAVEMEGYGVLRAVSTTTVPDAIVVRGISDLVDGKSSADQAGSQRTASENAASFAFELIKHLHPAVPPFPSNESADGTSSIIGELDLAKAARLVPKPRDIHHLIYAWDVRCMVADSNGRNGKSRALKHCTIRVVSENLQRAHFEPGLESAFRNAVREAFPNDVGADLHEPHPDGVVVKNSGVSLSFDRTWTWGAVGMMGMAFTLPMLNRPSVFSIADAGDDVARFLALAQSFAGSGPCVLWLELGAFELSFVWERETFLNTSRLGAPSFVSKPGENIQVFVEKTLENAAFLEGNFIATASELLSVAVTRAHRERIDRAKLAGLVESS